MHLRFLETEIWKYGPEKEEPVNLCSIFVTREDDSFYSGATSARKSLKFIEILWKRINTLKRHHIIMSFATCNDNRKNDQGKSQNWALFPSIL